MGAAVAFQALFGNSDNKLGNIVTTRDLERPCYPIDHGSALRLTSEFTLDPDKLLETVKEYHPLTTADRANQAAADDWSGQDMGREFDHRIDANPKELKKAKAELLRGIEEDQDRIAKLYVDFANLSDQQIAKTIGKFDFLMDEKDVEYYSSELSQRREECRSFVAEHSIELQAAMGNKTEPRPNSYCPRTSCTDRLDAQRKESGLSL